MMITPVILCGGSGTRLWPLSRRDFAKQHVPILGGESPFQRTLRRVAGSPAFGQPIVITNAGGRFMAAEQAAEAGVDVEIVIEPAARDTLPAIAAAADLLARRDPEGVALILPSDHLIPDAHAFAESALRAADAAADGALVAFGLVPQAPSTAYGYIRPGPAVGAGDARRIRAFVEKPDAARAETLIAEGCLWNGGMFCFRAGAGRDVIAALAPDVAAAVSAAIDGAADDLGALRLGPAFTAAAKISFDYGVMEKTDRALVVPGDFVWSDIGDWREIWSLSEKDVDGNAIEGSAVVEAGRDNYVRADRRLVCALGVDGLAIVDTPDAVLVAPLARTQEVKGLVAALAADGREEATTPARVHRPWGWYQTMDLGERFREIGRASCRERVSFTV